MARQRVDFTNKIVGTIRIGDRVDSGKHARFEITCTVCGTHGERDARYISRGCVICKSNRTLEGTTKKVLVVTPLKSYFITPLQILMSIRKHPDRPSTPEQARTRYYIDGDRVRVAEGGESVLISHPAIDGQEVITVLSKLDQQLDAGYDWIAPIYGPETGHADPFAFTSPLPQPEPGKTAPEPLERFPEDTYDASYEPPEGAFLLAREYDKQWVLDKDFPLDAPKYLQDWLDSFPVAATFRVMHANGQWYGIRNVATAGEISDEDLEDVMAYTQPPSTKKGVCHSAAVLYKMALEEEAKQAANEPTV